MRKCPPPVVKSCFFGFILLVIFALQPPLAEAQVITYEGDVFPESDPSPWARIQQGTPAQRWIDNGLFCQFINAQFDGYNRSISEFTGSPSFFVTWREITDSPRSVMSHTPNGMSVASNGPDVFAFTVTTDRVQFIRDNPIGLVLNVDIQPGVMHSYYLALHGDLSYQWYIDGVVVNSGQYPSAYPSFGPLIQWWARCFTTDPPQSAKWDYVRYGVIPADHSGDIDRNGTVDETDLYFFVDCLLGPGYDAAGPSCRWADMNADGKADGADIQQFVSAMVGT